MQLGAGQLEREPVVFDMSQIPEGQRDDANLVAATFTFGRVAFEDDLQTAVAQSHGIDVLGQLDMKMLQAVEEAKDYLAGRESQPLVLVDTYTRAGSVEKINYSGYIAQLGEEQPLVGLHPVDGRKLPGILVNGGYADFNSFYRQQGVLETQGPRIFSDRTVLPLHSSELTVGVPGGDNLDEDRVARQDILAGEEIVPWIISEFGDDANGYHFYRNVVLSVARESKVDQPALETLLVPPFANILQIELDMYRRTKNTLEDYDQRIKDYQRALDGAKAEANIALRSIRISYERMLQFMPRTAGSYPEMIASSLDDPYGPQTDGRIKAAARSIERLAPIVSWGIQHDKIDIANN